MAFARPVSATILFITVSLEAKYYLDILASSL
jgi:hypothetical protein